MLITRYPAAMFATLLLSLGGYSLAAETRAPVPVPVPFQGHDPNSTYTITYDDVDSLLDMAVINVGRSTRKKTGGSEAVTGTRVSSRVNRLTDSEGNRFYYETFKDDDDIRAAVTSIRKSLEQIPSEAPLELFSRDEQLAYWLNLYNVTILDELIDIYPRRSLKKTVAGKKSILSKKILNVAGVPLSLNDIQFTILKQNYDNNPLIIYGLYQGIIGGPNIRKRAYTSENVWRYLEDNAAEFINSNRGSYPKNDSVFYVSSYYERSASYFGNFQKDLKAHLLKYIDGYEAARLRESTVIKTNIDDWAITDLYGSASRAGGSLATNRAALMGSTQSVSPGQDGGYVTSTTPIESAALADRTEALSRFSPEVLVRLRELRDKRDAEAARSATVEIEDVEGSGESVPADGNTPEPK